MKKIHCYPTKWAEASVMRELHLVTPPLRVGLMKPATRKGFSPKPKHLSRTIMKKIMALLFFVPATCFAQWQDSFSDNDFTNNPAWFGDAAQFKINSSQQLQLNNSVAASSQLLTASSFSALNLEWHFWIKFSFSPSSNNFCRVYLTSDQPDLKGALNGYYLQFGEALSNDAVELFRQSGSASVSVCRGVNGEIANAFAISVKVVRDAAGLWTLSVDKNGGTNYVFEASGTDNTFQSSAYFGLLCTYTSSNASGFYFDDFYVGPVIVDQTLPRVSSVVVGSANLLDVHFSEVVETASAENTTHYFVNNGIGSPAAAQRDAADYSLVHLSFTNTFQNNTRNLLGLTAIADLAGNLIADTAVPFTYYIVEQADSGDVIINEILFHAQTGGSEFIELYNRSQKVLDLKEINIRKPGTNPYSITGASRLFLPGQYVAISKNISDIQSRYVILDAGALLQQTSLPAFVDGGDTIVIATASGKELDQLGYSESWQFPLLNNKAGVSLERLSSERPSQEQSNWHSAAETAGFATPGYRNSQQSDSDGDGNEISIEPEIFSPDNDGHNDVVNIRFRFEHPGFVANVLVLDAAGRTIRNLVSNKLLGNEGIFSWDGINDRHEKARTGIYVFYFELFDTAGNVKSYKRTCVLATKL